MVLSHELILDFYTTDVELHAVAEALKSFYATMQPGKGSVAISFRLGEAVIRFHPDISRMKPEWPVTEGFAQPVPFGYDPETIDAEIKPKEKQNETKPIV